MSDYAAIAWGAAAGLVLGIGIGLATDLPFAPEVGLIAGGLAAWWARRNPA